ncbi:MAG: hypothetical protein C4B57_00895 [Deltaproteobacteria bacterium]|nr:MAG: hypothetical protein C4B57_00895 [Deltaproteobacteria bacterium]RLB92230.1 MAG: hypothetical protein DRH50_10080 [Deltaproteobacteria bacterium]
MKIERVCGHSFSRDLLGNPAVVFDCGANHGEFSKWISENANGIVHGFEPDPRLFPDLPSLSNTHFHHIAVSGTGDPLRLKLGEARDSSAYFSEKIEQESIVVESIKLDEFCRENSITRVDLIKLDVEGAEIEILTNLPEEFLRNIGQITVEFHDFIQKADQPRIRNVISKLRNSGFFCVKFSHHDYSDVLCINTKIYSIVWWQILYIYIIKYFNGLLRLARRRLNF